MGDDRPDGFEAALGELRGRLVALEGQVARLQDRGLVPPPPDKYSGIKTAATFCAAVIVPVLVALIGGWFALRSAGLR